MADEAAESGAEQPVLAAAERDETSRLLAALATPKGQEIVDAAAQLFVEKSYDATGLTELASRIGMLKGSLYHYITTKDDLLFAIIDKVHQTSLANMVRWQPVDGSVHLKLRMFIKGHVAHFVENFTFASVFIHDFRSLSAARRQVIVAERDVYDGYLRTLLRQGQAEGVVCPDLDAKSVSMGIFGMMNWMYRWYSPEGSISPEALGDQFADLILGGVVCEPRQHRTGHKRTLGSPLMPDHEADLAHNVDQDVDLEQVLRAAQRAAVRATPGRPAQPKGVR
ncbi:TetR/AcrR family transcriptional regulator [Mycolicibacterium sphagni]|uniref:TetR/AcrR family transcriptional regulator n=1 Tax=Mycolicibacterium sphagni TaxID=1786 RepID=UPI0013FDA386|nr:TetR/AcrR family transcriptional regulator [Mycolicibacterium sphagni]